MSQTAFTATIILEYEGELPNYPRIKKIIEEGNIEEAKFIANELETSLHPVIYFKEMENEG